MGCKTSMSKLIKNTSFYTLGNILPKAAGFFLLPLYTRYLSPDAYGIVQSMHILSTIFTILFTLAIERSIYRLYYDYPSDAEKRRYLGTITISLIVIATAQLLIIFVFRDVVSLIFVNINFSPYYLYVIGSVYLSVFSLIPKVYLQVEQRANYFVILNVLEFTFKTALIIYFVVYAKKSAAGMLLGELLGLAILMPIYIGLLGKIISFKWDKRIFIESVSYSWPMIPSLLSAWILNLSDRIFIERYFTLADVGIYSLAYKLAELLLIITSAIHLAYSPLFFQIANSENKKIAKEKLYRYHNTIAVFIIIGATIISLFSKDIVMLLDAKYYSAWKLVPIIMAGIVFSQVGSLYNLAFYQEKKTKEIMVVSITGAIINIGLNYLFVPKYGSYGAALATLLSFIILFILMYSMAKQYYFIPLAWKENSVLMIVFFGLSSFFYIFDFSIIFGLSLKVLCVILICMIIYHRYSDIGKQLLKRY